MEKDIKEFLENISSKSTRELIQEHLSSLEITKNKEIVMVIDRKYAFNNLNSHEHRESVIKWLKKAFGEDKILILKLGSHLMRWEEREHHNREMNVPHAIRY